MKAQLHNYKLLISITMLLLSTLAFAQNGINYQGVARDAANEVLVNADITLDFNIVKISLGGETVYSETHTVSTDANGVFSVVIGNGTPTFNFFEDINWAEDKHFLNVVLNGTEIGTTAFASVPYAQAMGKWQAHKNGVSPKGTGGSIYIGDNAGENDDLTNNNNIGIGASSLQNNDGGYDNIGIGFESLYNNSDGNKNIAIGKLALHSNTVGENNIAIGNRALYFNSSGSDNIAHGYRALRQNETGSGNIANGYQSLYNNITGDFNIANGFLSLNKNTNGNYNIANGYRALYENTSGQYNIANGYEALFNNTIGENNIANGFNALYSNTMGNYNIANGYRALYENTSGQYNIANGFKALESNTSGSSNIAIGYEALNLNNSGAVNVACGAYALKANTTGVGNVAVGENVLSSNSIGSSNVGLGRNALKFNTSGNNNVALGRDSGRNNLIGNGNVFLGYGAGGLETGSDRLYIDNNNNTFPLIYGEFENNIIAFNAKVGIGTKSPEAPLQVYSGSDVTLSDGAGFFLVGRQSAKNIVFDNNEIQARENGAASTLYIQGEGGTLDIGGQVLVNGSVVHASDKRLKRDITNISYGLKDVLKLRPTEYFWKGKTQEYKSLGLIAQEVDEVIKNVVTYNNEQDKYGVSYTELIPVLIKAIQEQENMIRNLQGEVSELKISINNTSN